MTAALALASCGAPKTMSNGSEHAGSHAEWHEARLAALSAEGGWLTLVGLDFLPQGRSTIGSSPDATFSYGNCAAPIVGAIELQGESVRFTPTAAGGSVEWTADDRGTPSVVRSGTVSFTLVRRNGRLALRVRDDASPVRLQFAGIELFPFDPAFAVEAQVATPPGGAGIEITNVRGFKETQPLAAVLSFDLGGSACTLSATAGADGRLFVVFADATTGAQTYGGGRFLDIPAPRDGRTTIDFNRATNPPCSFTAFATCPLPPAGNRLSVAVTAGERRPRSDDGTAIPSAG